MDLGPYRREGFIFMFLGFKFDGWRLGALLIRSWFQYHLDGDIKELIGVVWSSRTSVYTELWIVKEFYR